MKVAIIGTGYVGLVSGACFADKGHDVLCVDIDEKRIEGLKHGVIPFYEPGLEEIVLRNHKSESLKFATKLADAMTEYEVLFFCLPTPTDSKLEKHRADLSHIEKVVHEAGRLKDLWGSYKLFVIKSTVPPGTNKRVKYILKEYAPEDGFGVVSNPEFLKEGNAIDDFKNPDRIIIGVNKEEDKEIMFGLYASYQKKNIITCTPLEAEIIKYFSNSILATKISVINDAARLCDILGANIEIVRKGVCADQRIGDKFLWPGCGYGGSCFPKDIKELIAFAEDAGQRMRIFEATEMVNNEQKQYFAKKIVSYFGDIAAKQFGIWGLSFKPETDDVREAPSIEIIKFLIGNGATVKAYDPAAGENARTILEKIIDPTKFELCKKKYDVLNGSDALVLITEWEMFRTPDFVEIKNNLRQPVIFDGRNIFGRDAFLRSQMERLGFDYIGVGCNFYFKAGKK